MGPRICFSSKRLLISSIRNRNLQYFQWPWIRLPYTGKSPVLLKDITRSVNTENYSKTSVTMLNHEEGIPLMINGVSPVGFLLNNGITTIGSLAIFPRSVLSWRIFSNKDINEDSLSLFYLLEPKLDMLVLGTGEPGTDINMKAIKFLRLKNISVEVLPTEKACHAFNFMVAEGRYVAAGLIPPRVLIRKTGDDKKKMEEIYYLEGKLDHIDDEGDDLPLIK